MRSASQTLPSLVARKETSHHSWVLLHGQALCSWGDVDRAAGLAKGYIPFTARSHLGDYILQTRSPRCSSTLWQAEQAERLPSPPPPTWCGRREESEPPVRNSGAHRGRGLAAFLPHRPRAAGGWRVPGSGERGGGRGSALLPGALWQPPQQALGLVWPEGQGSSSRASGPKTPSDPVVGARPSLQPASRSPSQAGIG